eukprot:TRINITY_DN10622_c0_g1_i1.p1 TRINITY_DN10622_c0_g1~~TRINITY_DN10622_c0_g1_i1.p1  ORF type:complete len:265 (+),score=54.19 TRINITY_DN10622_c0_g1_i1:134-928(+)
MAAAQDGSAAGGGGACSDFYDKVADQYNSCLFYDRDGPLGQWTLDTTVKHLELYAEGTVVADVGAGTGWFTEKMKAARPTCKYLAVEPSQAMLRQCTDPDIECHCMGGTEFTQLRRFIDRSLMAEMIHHIGSTQEGGPVDQFFTGLFECTNPGGIAVVRTRPHTPEYPFFAKALERWQQAQLPADEYRHSMERAGFSVMVVEECQTVKVPKEQWFKITRARFWSNYSELSDEEIEAGIRETDEKFSGDTLEFNEIAVFIIGKKD